MPPIFYLAVGRSPRHRDVHIARLVGQQHFLVPAGSSGAQLIRKMPDIHYVLDSGAWPPENPRRLTVEQYAQCIIDAGQQFPPLDDCTYPAVLDWVAPYDHLFDPERTAADARHLQALLPWHIHDELVIDVVQFPHGTADDVIGHLLYDITCLDDEELEALAFAQQCGVVDGPVGRPMCGVGNLVPQHYSRAAIAWLDQLLAGLSRADVLDRNFRSVHLFGVARPSCVLHELVYSFDSSGPFQQAQYGWKQIQPSYDPRYGYSRAKLERSREARVAYWISVYRARVGLPWSPVDERELLDDVPYVPRTSRLQGIQTHFLEALT